MGPTFVSMCSSGFFLTCEDLGKMFDYSFTACSVVFVCFCLFEV